MNTNPHNRHCLYCGEPLGDVHKSRKYCANIIMQDGSIKSCKDDFHNANKKIVRDATKNIARIQYKNFLILNRLYEQDKRIITKAELDKNGFSITFPITRAKIEGTNEFALYYIGYMLKQEDQSQLKIIKHEYKF